MKKILQRLYLKLFYFIACKRQAAKDLPDRYIHAHLVSVITTGILMWAYAIVACVYISHPLPGIVGIAASTIHLLSPLLYRRSNNYYANSNVFIGAEIVHQGVFSYFTGGFDSNTLIWLGILPMLSGVIAGRRGAMTWAFITSMTILFFLLLKLSGHPFPQLISPRGLIISQALILFGWIFISSVVIWVHDLLIEQNTNRLEASRRRNQNLVNIFSHDIATPLSIIVNKLKKILHSPLEETQKADVSKAFKAAESICEITKSVRELNLSQLDKVEISFSELDIRELVLELKDIFSERLLQKKIIFNCLIGSDLRFIKSNRGLLLHQILGNLLSNAIKFSPSSGTIKLKIDKLNDNTIEFILEDNGQGIPVHLRDYIFDSKYSKSILGTDGEIGTGFGLPIVKNCVEKLDGKILFVTRTSTEGTPGTSFKLYFPL